LIYLMLTTRPQPRSTLFPYTTLFRSLMLRESNQLLPEMLKLVSIILFFPVLYCIIKKDALPRRIRRLHSHFGAPYTFRKRGFQEDRNSTRLNSSHVSISYAVFCLNQK